MCEIADQIGDVIYVGTHDLDDHSWCVWVRLDGNYFGESVVTKDDMRAYWMRWVADQREEHVRKKAQESV